MRSLTELQDQCREAGIPVDGSEKRETLMDSLRDKIGTFDAKMQIDPAKAQDLKKNIDWPAYYRGDLATAFAKCMKYFTEDWILEPKLDGARIRAFFGVESNTMNTGRRSTVSYSYIERANNFPHLRDLVVKEFAGTILDGELMAPKPNITTASGTVTHSWLNAAMALINVNAPDSVATQKREGKAIFMAFDILAFKGESVMDQPLTMRRAMLETIINELNAQEEEKLRTSGELKEGDECTPTFQIIEQMESTVENVKHCLDVGLEGSMLKRKDSKYLAGKRMANWQKVKRMSTGDFFLTGDSDPGEGKNVGLVGSLKFAYKDENGFDVECGDVGSFTDELRTKLSAPDGKLVDLLEIEGETYKTKGLVIEVMGQGRTGKSGRIRHPQFVGFRPDKNPEDCTMDQFELFEVV